LERVTALKKEASTVGARKRKGGSAHAKELEVTYAMSAHEERPVSPLETIRRR